jgi:hypothetical protein
LAVVRREAGAAKATLALFAALAREKLAVCGDTGISFGAELSALTLLGSFCSVMSRSTPMAVSAAGKRIVIV